MSKVYVVCEKEYCDITILWAYTDIDAAAKQVDILNELRSRLDESGYYFIEVVEVAE